MKRSGISMSLNIKILSSHFKLFYKKVYCLFNISINKHIK